MSCSHVRYVCMYQELKKTQQIPCVCAHLANKAESDYDYNQFLTANTQNKVR